MQGDLTAEASRACLSPVPAGVGALRRCLDVAAASVLLVLVTPLLAAAALLVLVLDGRPVIFRQQRVGENGRPFAMLKLRTMRPSAGPAAAVTTATDSRVTALGRLLRRTSIDELPQLWHVLRGQMTLVGPRPESVELAAQYPERSRVVLTARPGLTGPAQLTYRQRSVVPPPGWPADRWYIEVLVPLRTTTDLEFLRHATLRRTLVWIWRTARLASGTGHYERSVPPGSASSDRPRVSPK